MIALQPLCNNEYDFERFYGYNFLRVENLQVGIFKYYDFFTNITKMEKRSDKEYGDPHIGNTFFQAPEKKTNANFKGRSFLINQNLHTVGQVYDISYFLVLQWSDCDSNLEQITISHSE